MKQKITGYVTQRKNSKYWSIVLYYRDGQGNRRQKWETTKIRAPGNKREVNAVLKERIDALEAVMGDCADPNMSIVDLMDYWLLIVRPTIRVNTYERYVLNANKIKNYYQKKSIKVVDYTRADARNLLNYLSIKGKDNKITGKKEPMATNTVRDIKSTLQMAFGAAVDAQIIRYNPVSGLRLRDNQKIATNDKYMTYAEARGFIDYVYELEDELADVITVAINYGLRRSEILGLRERDINLDQMTLTIAHTVTMTTALHTEDATKNKSSARVLPIATGEVAFWQHLIQKKRQNQKKMGAEYKSNDYLFAWADGTPYRPDYVTSHVKRLLKRFGRPELHLHSFRHTYCSLLYEQGVDLLTAQRLLGHAEGSATTMQVYTHLDRSRLKAHPVGLMPTEESKGGTKWRKK